MIPIDAKSIAEWIGDHDEEYDYGDAYNCAIAQYLKGNGATNVDGGPHTAVYDYTGESYQTSIPGVVESALHARPQDFQSLKKRLLAIA